MAGLPLLKLGGLLIKTVSKPVATKIKSEAGKHPNFSAMCSWVGQGVHQLTSRINVFANGYRFIGAKPLPEDQALKDGIDFLTESLLFLIAGSILVIEYNRSETKNAQKAAASAIKEANEKKALEDKFLRLEMELLDLKIQSLREQKKIMSMPLAIASDGGISSSSPRISISSAQDIFAISTRLQHNLSSLGQEPAAAQQTTTNNSNNNNNAGSSSEVTASSKTDLDWMMVFRRWWRQAFS